MKKNRLLFSHSLWLLSTVFVCCSTSASSKVSNSLEDGSTSPAPFGYSAPLDSVGAYALYLEITKGEVQAVQKMLPNVDDVNVFVRIDEDQHFVYSPLGIACKLGNEEIVEVLLTLPGIDLFLGCTDEIYEFDAVYVALESNRDSLFYKLIDQGAEIDGVYTTSGVTLLTVAVRNGNIPVVRYLLERGGLSPNGPGDLGGDYQILPLNIAVESNNLEMVEVLIEKGADPNLCDQQGATPYSLARKLGYIEIVNFLERYTDFGN